MTFRARAGTIARRVAAAGYTLLASAAILAVLSGLVRASGHPRAHTLMMYAAVAIATVGVALALPQALSTQPLTEEEGR